MKQNITLALEKDLLRQLRVIAAQDRACQRSKKLALKYLESGFHLGGRPADRDALHER
jgi:hypothetical protein